jgi:hypothetical protein
MPVTLVAERVIEAGTSGSTLQVAHLKLAAYPFQSGAMVPWTRPSLPFSEHQPPSRAGYVPRP